MMLQPGPVALDELEAREAAYVECERLNLPDDPAHVAAIFWQRVRLRRIDAHARSARCARFSEIDGGTLDMARKAA